MTYAVTVVVEVNAASKGEAEAMVSESMRNFMYGGIIEKAERIEV